MSKNKASVSSSESRRNVLHGDKQTAGNDVSAKRDKELNGTWPGIAVFNREIISWFWRRWRRFQHGVRLKRVDSQIILSSLHQTLRSCAVCNTTTHLQTLVKCFVID